MWLIVLQRILLQFFFDLIFFPIWWYSFGAAVAAHAAFANWQTGNAALAPMIWLRNLFVPMYGLTDWQGRIISVFVRLFNVLARTVGLLFWTLLSVAIFFVWLLALPAVVFMMIQAFRV